MYIDNSVGGYTPASEDLYYTVYYTDGTVSAPVEVTAGMLHDVPPTGPSVAQGGKYFDIVGPAGNQIDAVQLTMGDGTIKVPVIEFTTETTLAAPPIEMGLTATLTDKDGDQASDGFQINLQTDPTPGAIDDFPLTGLAGANSYNVDLALPDTKWTINGFDSAADTLVLLNPTGAISVVTGAGDDVITVGSKTVTVVNGVAVLQSDDIVVAVGETLVENTASVVAGSGTGDAGNDAFIATASTDSFTGDGGADSFLFLDPAKAGGEDHRLRPSRG